MPSLIQVFSSPTRSTIWTVIYRLDFFFLNFSTHNYQKLTRFLFIFRDLMLKNIVMSFKRYTEKIQKKKIGICSGSGSIIPEADPGSASK